MWQDKTADGVPYWWDATFDENTGRWSYHEVHDFSPVIEQNLALQKDASNGWTEERSLRLIGRIPLELYRDPDFRGLTPGEKQFFLRWFLEKHPEYRTVDKLLHVGANDGHVIVK